MKKNAYLEKFEKISFSSRPKIRWWIPGAQVTADELKAELASIKEAGFSGVEVCSMPYAPPGDLGVFTYTVDWGQENWNALMKELLEEAVRLEIKVDFMMTPGWPLALPGITDVDDPASGAQMEADGAWVDGITRENPYAGPAPVSEPALEDARSAGGTARLVGAAVARYVDKEKRILDFSSARSLKQGSEIRRLKEGQEEYEIRFLPESEGEYVLFAWWEHPSGSRTCGNLQLDHYGKAASKRLIDYWEEHFLPYYGDAVRCIDNMFIDSLEYTTHLDWTVGFLETFRETYGYDFTPYLPAVYDADWIGNFAQIPHPDFSFDRENGRLTNDFDAFLTDLYVENHLKPIEEFCRRHGFGLRYQTSYGKTLETAKTAMYVTVPETESLYGADLIDFYRLQSGAVHMTGKPIYSIETAPETEGRGNGDINSGNYQQGWHNLLWHTHRSLAGGVNQVVMHGYSYRGQYDGEGSENGHLKGLTWPGYEGMGSFDSFSNSWGERQPNWIHARKYTDYLARVQEALRQGEMKVDLAVYARRYFERIDFVGAVRIFDSPVLENAGYTYEYLCPAHLELECAQVEGGRLNPQGPAYKALIFDAEEMLSLQITRKVLEYAKGGLPILFVGNVPGPGDSMTESEKEREEAARLMEDLLAMENVRVVKDREQIVEALEEMGIRPDLGLDGSGRLLGVHRDWGDGCQFYLICNVGTASNYRQIDEERQISCQAALKGHGIPWKLDPWNGQAEPVESYRQEGEYLMVPITVQENDTCLLAVLPEGSESISPEKGEAEDCRKLPLTEWTLQLEKWLPGELPTETRKLVCDPVKLERLEDWNRIPGFEGTSGVGTYRTTVDLQESFRRAVLHLGKIRDSYRLKINGQEIVSDPFCSEVDVSPYMRSGENTVEVQVASTLLNAVITYSRESRLCGVHKTPDVRQMNECGMMGEVWLQLD